MRCDRVLKLQVASFFFLKQRNNCALFSTKCNTHIPSLLKKISQDGSWRNKVKWMLSWRKRQDGWKIDQKFKGDYNGGKQGEDVQWFKKEIAQMKSARCKELLTMFNRVK